MNKIKNNNGFTLVELLAATLIMLLVTLGLTTGVALSNKEFVSSIRQSEAQELYSTLSSLITNELRYTNDVVLDGTNVKTFQSVTYPLKHNKTGLVSLNEDGDVTTNDYGQLALGSNGEYNRLIGSASYTNNLGAKCSITYDNNKKLFTVSLDIGIIGGSSITSKTFNVRAINNIAVSSGS